jgi:RNA-directed DNA polymerase
VSEARPFAIPKQLVWDAYQRVKANGGAAGVDGVTLAAFETDLKNNLYKVWNRMTSGSYHPPPVRLVEIPKATGGTRPLGIPTVADRVAQTVVTMVLEPLVEPHFHPDSYAYRPGRSALDAVGTARKRCWRTAAGRHWMRSGRRGSAAGGPTGSSIWTSKLSLSPCRVT